MANSLTKRIILLDADVASHFLRSGEGTELNRIFPACAIHMLDKVHTELQRWPDVTMRRSLSDILGKKIIKLVDFPEDNEEVKREYFYIKKMLCKGDGESACMAVARYSEKILASSNLRDIGNYCVQHKIQYLTTMDFLCEAVRIGVFDETRADAFITKVLESKGTLPVKKFSEHPCRDLSFVNK